MARILKLADAVTTTGVKGTASSLTDGALDTDNRTFHATGETTAGVGAATVLIQVSNDGVNYSTAATVSLVLGTVTVGDIFAIDAPWAYVRAIVQAISGTGASVSVTMGF